MSNKKISPHQLRKGLTYVQQGPDFMRMLTGQTSNAANNDPRNPYRKPIGIEAKFQTENQSDDDDETAHDILNEREEERPTVVVLKDGKHLDERQVKNILKNLPLGLSDAEIQKRLAEELENPTSEKDKDDDEDEEDEQESVDANGKILFRKPKGSKSSSTKKGSSNSVGSKKSFEEALLGEAESKVQALKRKSGSLPAGSTSSGKKGEVKGNSDPEKRKKKQKTAKPTSLLSFDDEE
ncbi:hypothetical protein BG011_006691 [Mortierella polycephala]|uniref:DUF4604 domain-containing protein n=1 Tax=Mortierella polycephala TaxID=41804 RepID=A0A9P6PUN3_9FUNG|nr:hypothetical protein BG011_006691 [Mortierella polycephala]